MRELFQESFSARTMFGDSLLEHFQGSDGHEALLITTVCGSLITKYKVQDGAHKRFKGRRLPRLFQGKTSNRQLQNSVACAIGQQYICSVDI